jgi:hypothetical protein
MLVSNRDGTWCDGDSLNFDVDIRVDLTHGVDQVTWDKHFMGMRALKDC